MTNCSIFTVEKQGAVGGMLTQKFMLTQINCLSTCDLHTSHHNLQLKPHSSQDLMVSPGCLCFSTERIHRGSVRQKVDLLIQMFCEGCKQAR